MALKTTLTLCKEQNDEKRKNESNHERNLVSSNHIKSSHAPEKNLNLKSNKKTDNIHLKKEKFSDSNLNRSIDYDQSYSNYIKQKKIENLQKDLLNSFFALRV